MILTITTGRYAGSQFEISSPHIRSIHATVVEVEINIVTIVIDGVEGKEYFKAHQNDDRFNGLNDEERLDAFTTEVSNDMLPFVNEELVWAFEEKTT